jgi:hypothetical protein
MKEQYGQQRFRASRSIHISTAAVMDNCYIAYETPTYTPISQQKRTTRGGRWEYNDRTIAKRPKRKRSTIINSYRTKQKGTKRNTIIEGGMMIDRDG